MQATIVELPFQHLNLISQRFPLPQRSAACLCIQTPDPLLQGSSLLFSYFSQDRTPLLGSSKLL
jgi:hypothetical protein